MSVPLLVVEQAACARLCGSAAVARRQRAPQRSAPPSAQRMA
jgi:hypothetical protein